MPVLDPADMVVEFDIDVMVMAEFDFDQRNGNPR